MRSESEARRRLRESCSCASTNPRKRTARSTSSPGVTANVSRPPGRYESSRVDGYPLAVRRALTEVAGKPELASTKTEKGRRVDLDDACVRTLKAHKARMKPLESLGHDPSDLVNAFRLAQDYGTELYTGVLYRNPDPSPTLDSLMRERQQKMSEGALPRERILELFAQS